MSQCEYALRNAASPEDAHAALKVILGQSQKMSALISQLLTLARADRGALKLEFETINVSDITAMVVLEQESLAKKRGIHLQQEIQPDLLASVDETLLCVSGSI